MSTQRLSKKRVIIFVSIFIVLVAAAAAYYYWQIRPQVIAANPPTAAAQSEAKGLNLAGDQTLTARYIDQVNAKNTAIAQKLFDVAINQASDKTERQVLRSQNITVALSYGQVDTAERVAIAAIKDNPSYATYNDAYRVYVVKVDYAKQQEMLEKALAAAKTEDSEDNGQLIEALESKLQAVEQINKDRTT